MGTIITHGKGVWGRSHKHKRIDEDLNEESNLNDRTHSQVKVEYIELIEQATKNLSAGQTLITRLDIITPQNCAIEEPIIEEPIKSQIKRKTTRKRNKT